MFEEATHEAGAWRNATRAADIANAAVAGTHVTMTYQNGPGSHDIDFRGYAYERRLSELTGGVWLVYDEARPEVWRVPLYDEQVPGIVVDAPTGGYIIDGGFATAVKTVLDRHGIQSFRIADAPDVNVPVEVFRPTATRFLPPYEGRTRVELEGAWTAESRVLDRGALFVPIARPRARLVLHLLEPLLPDSLAQWGMFNAVFERKEYLEPYVLERAARDMLQARPALQAELDAAIDADPSLADPMRKLDWFYRRHPAWDERVDLLPVYRTSQRPGGAFKLGAAADVDR